MELGTRIDITDLFEYLINRLNEAIAKKPVDCVLHALLTARFNKNLFIEVS